MAKEKMLTIDVCSAHAEMVPEPIRACWSCWGLLRTRGDGPTAIDANNQDIKSAPHTRRWSQVQSVRVNSGVVCSAHAEMVPLGQGYAGDTLRLLRTRGDGPYPDDGGGGAVLSAPHTRRWSHHAPLQPVQHDVCSAHAEMVPRSGIQPARNVRLLRTRGDVYFDAPIHCQRFRCVGLVGSGW